MVTGIATNRFYYDKNDRLIGSEYANGLSIAYVYDGNNNLLEQVYGSRQTQVNNLPPWWLAKYGLTGTNAATANGPYDDPDGDGWSNWQEWSGGSNPGQAASVPTNAPQTAPLAAVIPGTNSLGALAVVPIRLWDNEGNASLPFLQYSNASTVAWSNAALTHVDGTNYSGGLRVAALPTGSDHALTWSALQDLGSVRTNVFLRARAMDVTLTGDWSAPMEYLVDTMDSNQNGIPDSWELQYFGYVGVDPNADPDHDGFSNLQEYIADTNLTNATSYLRITSVSVETNGVRIIWAGGVQARQYLQRADGLDRANVWTDLQVFNPPTLTSTNFLDVSGTNNASYYRIRVERP